MSEQAGIKEKQTADLMRVREEVQKVLEQIGFGIVSIEIRNNRVAYIRPTSEIKVS